MTVSTKEAAFRVSQWASWQLNVSRDTALGFPASTAEGRFALTGITGSGQIATSRVPDFSMPPVVRAVHYALERLPEEAQALVMDKHLRTGSDGAKRNAWCRERGWSRTRYYAELEKIYAFIAGALAS